MKFLKLFTLFVLVLATLCLPCPGGEETEGGWTEVGELAYSYAYARTWLGHQMRKDGWKCTIGFTAGRKGEQEHSVWVRGRRKMQMMIWRIDSNRTGYSKGEIPEEKTGTNKRAKKK